MSEICETHAGERESQIVRLRGKVTETEEGNWEGRHVGWGGVEPNHASYGPMLRGVRRSRPQSGTTKRPGTEADPQGTGGAARDSHLCFGMPNVL